MDNGTVKAQGEDVKQVLVDGRPFFGTDPTLALRNLPSEVIDKVQVFDKLSDQAQLTGFDDGQSVKTMNIVTRTDRRQGQFGRLNAGYGTEDRYTAGGNFNDFTADRRLSLILLTNNVNQQNFATQDLFGTSGGGGGPGGGGGAGFSGSRLPGGGTGRRGGGGGQGFSPGQLPSNFLVGQQSGISSVHSIGSNYADSLGDASYLTGSYFFNRTDNSNPQNLTRQYLAEGDSISRYMEASDADKKNFNHRLNLRLETALDSSNALILTPQLFLQENSSASLTNGSNLTPGGALFSSAVNNSQTSTSGNNYQAHAVYRHKFTLPGRTFSLDFGVGGNSKTSSATQGSGTAVYSDTAVEAATLQQLTSGVTDGVTLSGSLVYTEPIGTFSLLQANYNPSYTRNTSDNRTYTFDTLGGGYSMLNTDLSNSFENTYITHNAGLGYRVHLQSFNATLSLAYQTAILQGNQTYPRTQAVRQTFNNILPGAMLNYEISRRRNIRLMYRTSTVSPTISQLQNLLDNSNPLFLSAGDPDLRPSYSHTLLTRAAISGAGDSRSLFLFLYLSITKDYIGNSTINAVRDTVVDGGVQLSRGTQLTVPVNLDGNWSARTFCTYGFPLDFLGSNINVNAGLTFSRTPGIVNGYRNVADVIGFSPGAVIGSNISEDVDFTVSYSASFNRSRNTQQTSLDNSYFTHTAAVRLNLDIPGGFVLRNDVTNSLTSGLGAGYDQSTVLWDASIGKKMFSDQRGELLLSVHDILDQNRNVSRNITETYVEDTVTRVLTRYIMLSFSYTVRAFQVPRSGFPRPDFRD